MPEWNLADLYPAPDAPEVARDLEGRRRRGAAHQGAPIRASSSALAADGASWREAIEAYERFRDADGQARLLCRACSMPANQADPERAKFYGDIRRS